MGSSNISMFCLTSLGIPLEVALEISKRMRVVTYLTGESFFERGRLLPGAIYVVTGSVVATAVVGDELSCPINIYGQAEWVGFEILLSKLASPVDLVAATDVHCLMFPRSDVRAAYKAYGQVAQAIGKLACTNSALQVEQLAALRLSALPTRAMVLLALIVEKRVRCLNGNIPDQIMILTSQETLAKVCGVSRTLMSGYLQQLKIRGLVELNYKGVTICRAKSWLNYLSEYRKINTVRRVVESSDAANMIDEHDSEKFQSFERETTIPGYLK